MKTIKWEKNHLLLIDQRKLPDKLEYFKCENYKDVIFAIKNMVVRGAPAIGVAAAFAVALADLANEDLEKAAQEIRNSRPTAINLQWAVKRTLSSDSPLEEALRIYREDMETTRAIGEHGAALIDDGDTILTHCNAGALACVDYGTALGVIRAAHNKGKRVKVFCNETRPLGQGARLSVWELQMENIPVKLIVDSASGYLMQQGEIDKVIIGADRIAKGGVVNKIGSLMVALAAKRFKVPFYVAAPMSTFDEENSIYDTIIEERGSDEVLYYGGCRIAPKDTEVFNPAFDIVPSDLITAIITEDGIIDPL
ncbi:S-methyl-5-thioribose-1-phosphate isomerase [Methanothermobacter tenebrarum]|uniref:Putative methylthioribose-1-phosphate isomerase n=1 Tax=Methanothermobacter tenebrarum TaxID=680118 RepID=A0A328PEW1_9EURY|nr:S-methyl-5-thioribose-1-phosphate isomerase [Methanothermobacter tenebrarum]MBC7100543.1 S-methyl-5-thioribose-1-phosphate isomerase [Methanobacteriales archaeon]MBC7118602.1 S-methyl-5-thioribose-1-phosphate isomerase [Methanobacteriaceae archaeon]NPV64204.1 S-methyl-5-thioribose-1-phosphate isomerase [Methanobacteriaceae archaeon]RAO79821.1 S-methyl-5-thioribose-1-phosphate isomerase [Methanothermobacter tenebrarum]